MGWAHFRMGNLGDSEKFLRRALNDRPDPEIAAHLGEVLWAKGERDRAKEVWQSQLKETPDNPVLLETVRRLAHVSAPRARLAGPSARPRARHARGYSAAQAARRSDRPSDTGNAVPRRATLSGRWPSVRAACRPMDSPPNFRWSHAAIATNSISQHRLGQTLARLTGDAQGV